MKRTTLMKAAMLTLSAIFFGLPAAHTTSAATYTVTTNADTGAGSLRQAVLDANGTAAADVIVFNIPAASCSAAGVCTITLASEITIDNNGSLTINGAGANRLTIDGGAGTNRIFYSNAATFTLSGATLTGGNGTGASNSGSGGAILAVGGTTKLNSVYITGNTSTGGFVGGVYFLGGANHQINNSTFSGNTSGSDCGAFYVSPNTSLTAINTTVSGNTAAGRGSGFCNDGTMTARHLTVAGNTGGGSFGGGVFVFFGSFNMSNSIIAGNTGGTRPDINNAGSGTTITSAGNNLIGDNTSAENPFPAGNPNANNDLVGTTAAPVNPLLDPLANYGGTVPTMRLQAASPAIDKGSLAAGVSADARGVIRPFDIPLMTNAAGGNGADIGAFELQISIVKDFGFNQFGQLGLGSLTDQSIPQILAGFNDITQFGGGYKHSIALRADGTVLTAGDDSQGQLGDGTIGGGNRLTFGQVVTAAGGANLSGITSVVGGNFHNLALRSDGTVWAWGYNFYGQLGNGTTANSAIPVQVGAGIAGFNTHVVAISAGAFHSLALTDDGKVWAWGSNGFGQLGDGTQNSSSVPISVKASAGGAQLAGIEQISAGDQHSVALTSGGAVLVWGTNGGGQVGNGTADSAVLYPAQTTAALMGTVVQISAGNIHNVAVNTAGDVYAWGEGGSGQLGDGTSSSSFVPRKTSTVSNVVRIEAHYAYHTLARRRDGTLFVWGLNGNGQIGNGTTANQSTPLNLSSAAGTGGNLGASFAVFGAGSYTSFTSTLPEIATPAGANTLRGDNFSVRFPASTVAGTTQVRTFDPTAAGLAVPAGYTLLSNSTGYDFTSTAQFPSAAVVCLQVSNVISQTAFNQLFILHDDDFDGTLDGLPVSRDYQKREICRAATSFSPFVLASNNAGPTAADVEIGGRVQTAKGQGITNVTITLTDMRGKSRTVTTSSFGYYRFPELKAGATYIVTATAKRFTFGQPTQIVSAGQNLDAVNFTANP